MPTIKSTGAIFGSNTPGPVLPRGTIRPNFGNKTDQRADMTARGFDPDNPADQREARSETLTSKPRPITKFKPQKTRHD